MARCQSQHPNEFDVRSVLHGQVSLADVNQINVFHEAMNGCKNLKINKRLALNSKYSCTDFGLSGSIYMCIKTTFSHVLPVL